MGPSEGGADFLHLLQGPSENGRSTGGSEGGQLLSFMVTMGFGDKKSFEYKI